MTVAELQNRVTQRELRMWQAYIKKNGPMNDIRRHDRPAALVGSILAKVNGNKLELKDLLPFYKEEEKVATIDDIVAMMGGASRGKR